MVLSGIPGKVIDKITKELGLQTARERTLFELMPTIQPVISTEPEKEIQMISGTVSDGTSTAIMTTHATKDTFITSISLAVSKDVVNTSIFTVVTGFPDGAGTVNMLMQRYEPVTAGQFHIVLDFPIPIKMAKNTTVTLQNSSGLASIDSQAIVTFYEVDR